MSTKYNFIYLKTHKTGSTSVELILEPLCAPPKHKVFRNRKTPLITDHGIVGARGAGRDTMYNRREDPTFYWNHMGAKRVVDRVGKDVFFSKRRVACVRNPFTRLLSQFFFKSIWIDEVEAPTTFKQAYKEFEKFIFSDPREKSNKMRIKRDHHLAHFEGELILTDYIRLEHMRDDLQAFLAKLGADYAVPEKHERDNASKMQDWSVTDFFDTPEKIDRAVQIDRWAFDLAGYSTDPADA